MDDVTYNKKELRALAGYTLAQVIAKNGVVRMVFTNGPKAAVVDVLADPEGNGPGYAAVLHV
ncbi:MAG TPA: hypothetical protein VFH61_06410 [Thermoleophilia bacterium]|nr:hypothetical protein [Thermoleophilia bacterium]